MKPRFAIFFALVLVPVLLAGCGDDPIAADTTPPLAPALQGATLGSSVVGAWWAPNTEPDLEGYNVYVNQDGQTWLANQYPIHDNFVSVQIEDGSAPVHVFVTAIDRSANESSPSATRRAAESDPNLNGRETQTDQPQDQAIE